MQRVWSDIDQARDKLGLRASAEPEPAAAPTWSIGACLGQVVELVAGVGAWIGDLPLPWPASASDETAPAPTVRNAVAAVPIVGPLVAPLLGSTERADPD